MSSMYLVNSTPQCKNIFVSSKACTIRKWHDDLDWNTWGSGKSVTPIKTQIPYKYLYLYHNVNKVMLPIKYCTGEIQWARKAHSLSFLHSPWRERYIVVEFISAIRRRWTKLQFLSMDYTANPCWCIQLGELKSPSALGLQGSTLGCPPKPPETLNNPCTSYFLQFP